MVERIGSYEILGELGHGASGVVYRARQASLNREVALKVLSAALAADPDYVARFHREAETAASLDHPLIVTIYDTGVADGYHYIAMRQVQGVTLEAGLRARQPDLPAALGIAGQIAEALAYAHGKGIVHRDLKPANVLVTGEGRIALADFGIARATEATGQTIAGQVLGTPEYMSPEQARGEKADARSDLYALGMILYTMLGGRPAFSGGDALSVIFRQASEAPVPLRELNPSVPEPVADLVHTLLAKDPEQRFQSAAALGQALTAVQASLAGGAAGAPAVPAAGPDTLVPPSGGHTLSPPASGERGPVAEQNLAVLSLDIVRSTQMKQLGATETLATLFSAYRTLVNTTIQENGSLDHCWSGDGLLALFPDVEGAVRAAETIQRAVPRLNREHHAEGPGAMKVRGGVHFGLVPWEPGVPVGEVISLTLDIAGRLQKAAQPGEVAASWQAFSALTRREGFLPGPKTGPLAGAYCWSEWQEQQDVAPAAPPSEAPLDPAVTNQLKAALAMQAMESPASSGSTWPRIVGILVGIGATGAVLYFIGRSLMTPVKVDNGRPGRAVHAARGGNEGDGEKKTRSTTDPKRGTPGTPAPAPTPAATGGVELTLPAERELSWTYAERGGQAAATKQVTETLSGQIPLPGQVVARLGSDEPAPAQPALLARVQPDGLAVYGTLDPDGRSVAATFSPPYRLLPNPLPLDSPLTQPFTVAVNDPTGGQRLGQGRVLLTVVGRPQKRRVPAGEFDAYPFQLDEQVTLPGQPGRQTLRRGWLAPAVGIIEEQVSVVQGAQRQEFTRALVGKSF